jgi:WD40 repeat protein
MAKVEAKESTSLRLWDLKDGQTVRTFERNSRDDGMFAMTPDGLYVLSTISGGTICVWDLQTGHEVVRLNRFYGGITAFTISQDGDFLLSGSADGTMKMWDLRWYLGSRPDKRQRGRKTQETRPQASRLRWLRRDLIGRRPLQTTRIGKDTANVAIAPDGSYALALDKDRRLTAWNLQTGKKFREADMQEAGMIPKLAKGPDIGYWLKILPGDVARPRALFGRPDRDNQFRLWDLETGSTIRIFSGHSDGISRCVVSQDWRRCLTGSQDKTLRLWDLESGETIRIFDGHSGGIASIAMSPDGRHILSSSEYEWSLRVWSVETGKTLRTFEGHTHHQVTQVAITPDGRYGLSCVTSDNTLRLWDLETCRTVRTFTGHCLYICCVDITPDGRHVVSASCDGTLRLWDLQTGDELARVGRFPTASYGKGPFESESFYGCVISPDGRYVRAWRADGTISLWDMHK